ncbi:hypothetical protein DLM_4210 [Aquitalea magnusonii]|uniref:Uncharacterized protein n=1 Tax=Aquitalea magnusonii TaxID=332411 RepID=A0A3G9GM41_9NEIS|nr:hypothetical protein DLM_4210 [Aquitalea magnusonii]
MCRSVFTLQCQMKAVFYRLSIRLVYATRQAPPKSECPSCA